MTFVSFFWQVKLEDPSSWPRFSWCTAWLQICSKLASCLLKQSMPLRRCIASIQQPSRGLVWHICQQDNLLGILLVVSRSCSPSASFHWKGLDAEIYQDDQMIFSKLVDTNQLNHICSWNGQQRCADLIPFFVEFQLRIQNPCYCFWEPLCHPINPKIYNQSMGRVTVMVRHHNHHRLGHGMNWNMRSLLYCPGWGGEHRFWKVQYILQDPPRK